MNIRGILFILLWVVVGMVFAGKLRSLPLLSSLPQM